MSWRDRQTMALYRSEASAPPSSRADRTIFVLALILIAILGFVFVFSLIISFVILLKRRRRGSSPTVREGVLPASVNESLR